MLAARVPGSPTPQGKSPEPGRALLRQPAFWLGASGLILLCAAVFGQAVHFELLSFDDDINISLNPHMGSPTVSRMAWAFGDWSYVRRYVPLGWLTFFGVYGLSGLSPVGFHLAALLLHALNALLVWWTVSRLLLWAVPLAAPGKRHLAAWIGAAWWAVHPQRAELAAWASGIFNLQGNFFLLVSLAAAVEGHLDGRARARPLWASLSLAAYAMSLLSYPTGIGFAVVLVMLDAFLGRRRLDSWQGWARLAWGRAAWLLLALLAGGAAVASQRAAGGLWRAAAFADLGWAARFTQVTWSLVRSLWMMACPLHLSPIYDTFVDFHPAALQVVAAAAAALAIAAGLLRMLRRGQLGLLCLCLSYAAAILPYAGWVGHTYNPSDRYSYIPSVAAAIGLSWLVATRGPWAWRLGLCLVAALALSCFGQTADWRDDVRLLGHIEGRLADSGARAEILMRIGAHYFGLGDYRAAERYSRAGMVLMQLPPNAQPVYGIDSARGYPDGAPLAVRHDLLGVLHARSGEMREAEDHLRLALEISPAFVRANIDLAPLLSDRGETLESLHCLLRAERGASGAADARTIAALMRSLARDFGDEGRTRLARALEARADRVERAGDR